MLHARQENIDDQYLGSDAIALVDQDAAAVVKKKKEKKADEPVLESRMGDIDEDGDTGKDSGNESAETDSDSEDKKESIKAIKNALVGMNVSLRFFNSCRLMVIVPGKYQLSGRC